MRRDKLFSRTGFRPPERLTRCVTAALATILGMVTRADYPEELTIDEFDDMPWELCAMFGTDPCNSVDDDLRQAALYAGRHHCRIYTQVDGPDGLRVYLDGPHVVNRTGVFAAVRLPGTATASWLSRLRSRLG